MTTTSSIDYEIQESQPPAGVQIIDHLPRTEGVTFLANARRRTDTLFSRG